MAGPRRKRPRSAPSLRDAHVSQTRTRILEALFDELRELEAVSLPRVAARAGVSIPTVYRHFPDRASLTRAAVRHFEQIIPIRREVATLEQLIAFTPDLYLHFDRHEKLLRARFLMNGVRNFRSRLLQRAADRVTQLVSQSLPQLPPAQVQRVAAILRVLSSAHAWELMRDNFGLRGREAGEAAAWAIEVLCRDLRSPRARGA
jgi:AcrR family transcriptional regulator